MASTNRKIAVNYGVIYGVISVVLVVIQYAMGAFTVSSGGGTGPWYTTALSVILAFLFPILAIIQIKKAQGGFISLGEGFRAGFTIFIINAIFVAVWMLLYTLVLEPGYQEQLIQESYSQMQQQNPNMSEAQMEQAIGWTKNMTSPWLLALFSIVGSALMGAIVSLIVALILQKKRPESL